MLVPGKPANETARVQALHGLELLDSAPEERFDRLTRLARRLFNVPIALVTLVDTNRQWFKSCVGLDVRETPRMFHSAAMRFLTTACCWCRTPAKMCASMTTRW